VVGAEVLELLAAVAVPVPVAVLSGSVAKDVAELEEALHALERDGYVEWSTPTRVTCTDAGAAYVQPALTAVRRARLRGLVGRAVWHTDCFEPPIAAALRVDASLIEADVDALDDLLAVAEQLHRVGRLDDELGVLRVIVGAIGDGHVVRPATQVKAISRLSFLLRFSGHAAEAAALGVTARAAARRSDDAAALAAAALAWRPESISMSDDPSVGVALIDEALALGQAHDLDVRARLLAAKSEATVFTDLAVAQSAGAEALALAREAGDPTTFVIAAYAYHVAHWHPRRQVEMLALGTEMVTAAERSAEFTEYGACTRLHVFLELGDWAHVDTELAAMGRRLAAAPRPYEQLWYDLIRTARLQTRGEWAEAERTIGAALAAASGPDYGSAHNLLLGQMAINAWHQGHDLSMLSGPGLFPAGPMSRVWQAGVVAWAGRDQRRGEVATTLDELLADGVASVRPDMTYGLVIGLLASATADVGSTRHAAALHDELARFPDQWAGGGGALVVGPNRYHLGRLCAVLGRVDEGVGHLQLARRQAAAGGCRPWEAWIELALAEILAGRQPAAAREHAKTAMVIAAEMGMATVAARAEATLGAARLPAGLTAREGEVLSRAAAGASNQLIADTMHLSVKTVERHLQNSYRKIGVRNRAEAAAFVARELS
jgi:DNA-binding CsgD family transcriptional regulator